MKHLHIISIAMALTLVVCTGRAETIKYDDHNGLSSLCVGGGLQDRYGLLWFATWSGLQCYDGYEFHRISINPGDGTMIGSDHIRDIRLSPEGNIWCHTDDDVYEFNLSTFTFKEIPRSMKGRVRTAMGKNWHGMKDKQGNTWTADEHGLYKTMGRHYPAKLLQGTENACSRALLVDRQGRLWVGLRSNNAIHVYNKEGEMVQTMKVATAPYCLFQTSSGDVWVGGKAPGALFRIGEKSISDDIVYDIKEDKHGRLWIATFGDGVKCCAAPNSGKPVMSRSLGGKKVRQLLVTPRGNIVAATTDGLLIGRINEKNVGLTVMRSIRRDGRRAESLSSNALLGVAQNAKGEIFVATECSGIDVISEESLFSGAPRFRHINERNSPLTSNVCKAMTLLQDSLLVFVGNDNVTVIGTNSGNMMNYGSTFWTDSCRFMETVPVCLADGTWVLGSEQGALFATQHSLLSRGYVPPLLFTSISRNGGRDEFMLVPRHEVTLGADERNVTIRFAAIDYCRNSQILYRTRVDGSVWILTDGSRSVTLFNLTPGRHTLEVQSTDGYRRWVDNVKTLTVIVEPYWYETWWARSVFAILALMLIGGGVYLWIYIRNMKRQRRELLGKLTTMISERQTACLQDDPMEYPADVAPTDERAEAQPDSVLVAHVERSEDALFLDKVRRYIEDNLSNPDANVNDMAMYVAASRSTLNRRLRRLLGVSATQLLIEARMKRAEELLGKGNDMGYTMNDIASMCGYSDMYYFRRVLKDRLGK